MRVRLHHRRLRARPRGCASIPRLVVGNVIAILAARRALALHVAGGPQRGTRPATSSPPRRPRDEPVDCASSCVAVVGWVGLRAAQPRADPRRRGVRLGRERHAQRSPLPPVAATAIRRRSTRSRRRRRRLHAMPPGAPPIRALCRAGPSPPAYSPGGAASARHSATPRRRRLGGPDRQAARVQPRRRPRRAMRRSPPLDEWPLSRTHRRADRRAPAPPRAAEHPAELIRTIRGIDRLSMSAWAMLRGDPGPALARHQRPARRQPGRDAPAVALRPPLRREPALERADRRGRAQRRGRRRAALAAVPRVPVALTAERRQSFGPDKGRSAFALFAEGGVYDRPIVAGFNLDAYLQAGVVGFRDRDLFVDGVGDADPAGVAPVQRRLRPVGRRPAGPRPARRRARALPMRVGRVDARPPRLSPAPGRQRRARIGPGGDARRQISSEPLHRAIGG